MEVKVSNYDLQQEAAARAFAAYDLEKIGALFALRRTDATLYFPFLGEEYAIDRATGRMEAPFGIAMTAYDYLTNPYGPAVLQGQWCAHENLNAVQGGTLKRVLSVSKLFAASFDGKLASLKRVCASLGALSAPKGDYSCVLPLFPGFSILLRYWEADEEFPAQVQLLWDKSTTHYIRYETTYYTAGAVLNRLAELL